MKILVMQPRCEPESHHAIIAYVPCSTDEIRRLHSLTSPSSLASPRSRPHVHTARPFLTLRIPPSGAGLRISHLPWAQGVRGSNPRAPTKSQTFQLPPL